MKSDAVLSKVRKLVCGRRGSGCIVVLHRGWIFAGNLTFDESGQMYTLTDAVNVRSWQSGGFGGLSKSAKTSCAVLDPCEDIVFAPSAMIFSVPLMEGWDA